jgi:hypothetical protein
LCAGKAVEQDTNDMNIVNFAFAGLPRKKYAVAVC